MQEKQTRLNESWYIRKADCNTSVMRLGFCFNGVQCISNCACVKFPYTTCMGSDPNQVLFLSCHTGNMHTSILSYCPRAFALNTESIWNI